MSDELNPDKVIQTPGPLLRAAREQIGLTTQQVAQRLNLRHSVVVGMEQDQFEPGTSVTYIRGYLRNYARLVSVDEQLLNEAIGHLDPKQADHAMQSFSRRTNKEKADNRWMMATWIIAAGILGLVIWWWVAKEPERSRVQDLAPAEQIQNEQSAPEPQLVEPAQTETDAVQPEVDADEAEIIEPEAAQSQEAEPEAVQPQEAEVESQPEPQSDSAATQPANREAVNNNAVAPVKEATQVAGQAVTNVKQIAADLSTMTIKLEGECWMLVQDADGKVIIEGLKRAGFEKQIAAKAPLKLRLGAPETVSLSLDGETVDLSSFQSGKVARLTLPL